MNSETLYWWLGLLGSIASLIGLPVAIWQIYKTKKIALAAKTASLETQRAISRNLLLSDVSVCVRHIEEIRLYLGSENYELAQVRVNDLNSQLMQIQAVLIGSKQTHQIDFEEILREIKKTRSDFRKKIDGGSVKINTIRVNAQLDIVSDNLNKLIGETKIVIEKGD